MKKEPVTRQARDGFNYILSNLCVLIRNSKENLNEEVEEPLAAVGLIGTSLLVQPG